MFLLNCMVVSGINVRLGAVAPAMVIQLIPSNDFSH